MHCEWDGSRLILQADNDFDSNGLALLHEFPDAISASITDGFDGGIDVVSVAPCRLTPPPNHPPCWVNECTRDVTPTSSNDALSRLLGPHVV